jgi:16S rRNA (adenine1518-N6/adenine1519-N6)-dimethyltransferase
MHNLENLPSIEALIKSYNLDPKKELGQNFLRESYITDQIASSVPNLKDAVIVEVGPGPGGLTRSLLKKQPKKLYAIEYDKRAIAALSSLGEACKDSLELIEGDALQVDYKVFGDGIYIIANLPYNIGTKLVVNWLTQYQNIKSITVMLQKEVAAKIAAKPRSADYSRLSVISQLYAEPTVLFDVAAENFYPAPKVTSSVIHLNIKQPRPSVNLKKLEHVLALSFSHRRKMLRKTLNQLILDIPGFLGDIDPEARPEELSVNQFIELANKL